MNKAIKYITGIVLFLIALYLLWFFSDIVVYVFLAGFLSIVGHPLVNLFDRIKFGRYRMPHALSAVLTLLVLITLIVTLVVLFVPVIARQAEMLASINVDAILNTISEPVARFEAFLRSYNLLGEGESIENMITARLKSVLNLASFSDIFQNLLSLTGTLFIGIFAVIFLAFFFLKDRRLLKNGIMLFVPEKHEEKASHALSVAKNLITRYFIGLSIEILLMIALLYIGFAIFGVKSALLIAFLGGVMKIIPYIGPIIGITLGIVAALSSSLSMGIYTEVVPITLKILGVYIVADIIDNLVFQPVIYSSSVKAHPIEIFLVILMAGSLAGITGMILAIPVYTLLRIVAKEFLSQFKLVKKLTENI